jgi:hypothetical protein
MATLEFARAGDSGTRSRRPRSQIFCQVPVVQEGRGGCFLAGNIRPALPEMNCDLDKSAPVARDRIKESRPTICIGGVGVRERGTPAPGPWDPSPRPRGSGPLSPAREAGGAEDRLWNSGHRDRFDRLL